MTPDLRTLLWTRDARWITSALALHILNMAITLPLFGPPYAALTATILIGISAIIGYRSSKMFGGRRNFTGRFLLYFSIGLALLAFGSGLLLVTPLNEYEKIIGAGEPTPLANLINLLFLAGLAVVAYTLMISVRTLFISLDKNLRDALLLSLSLFGVFAFVNILANVPLVPSKTLSEALASGVPWLVVFLFTIPGALMLVTLLGRWYAAQGIGIVAYGYVFFVVTFPLLRAGVLLLGVSLQLAPLIIQATVAIPLSVVGLGMNQARPRTNRAK